MRNVRVDPRLAIRRGRRRLAAAERAVVEWTAGLAGRVPADRLDLVLATPARRAILEAIFWQMPQQVDRRRAAGVDSVVRWRITTPGRQVADLWTLVIADGAASVVRGRAAPDPRVTITVDGGEFIRLVTGHSNPMQAYFSGKLAVTGDIVQVARVVSLFQRPATDRGARTA